MVHVLSEAATRSFGSSNVSMLGRALWLHWGLIHWTTTAGRVSLPFVEGASCTGPSCTALLVLHLGVAAQRHTTRCGLADLGWSPSSEAQLQVGVC